ncbi:maltokinase N-terminal cap-like domain-containing protein [Nakamurella lactea]|uniref:maltokinase N-terminal cap-like domain-containing protein n=1 Tax=Nakamurella lactea TaxID=459515 RepID=UPI000411F100|nr:hypothetical protein [Nakamurella lactea]
MTADRPEPVPTSGAAGAAAVPDTHLELLLTDWLPAQRWFAGRDELVGGVRIAARSRIAEVDGAVFEHLLIEVPGTIGTPPRTYQVWLGRRTELPERLAHSEIGALAQPTADDAGALPGADGAVIVYDALHDPALTSLLLTALAGGSDLGAVHATAVPGADLDVSAPGLVISAEQSNTSVVFGESAILKIFRRLSPGRNPDGELLAALATAGSTHAARLLGELSGEIGGVSTTFGVLTEFFANSADGWQMATASVRDLMAEGDLRADEVGGDFAAEAHRLGAAVAAVHRDLADELGTTTVHEVELRRTIEQMATLATETIAVVPDLQPFTERIMATFDEAGSSAASLTLQRIHGDLHLGQVLRTLTGWALIDFEGEPSKPLDYRRAQHSTLRDIAGMLRSFDYAAHHLLPGSVQDSQHTFRAGEWSARNRRAFCDGYAEAARHDPRNAGVLLRAFELDKAVYEVRYEHDHRPAWLPIPMLAIDQLTRPKGTP